MSEERSQHDIEYPDIPSIPEEAEEDMLASPRGSPVVFPEFDPDTSGRGHGEPPAPGGRHMEVPAPGGRHGAERREGGGEVEHLPWQGLARKGEPSNPSIATIHRANQHMNTN